MPSPFLGMDPYIETPELWSDFHSNVAPTIQATLNQMIRPRYFAGLVPYVTYELIEVAQARGISPDITTCRSAARTAGLELRSGRSSLRTSFRSFPCRCGSPIRMYGSICTK